MKDAEQFTFSFWEQDIFLPKADLVVIGGGIVGMSAALEYKTLHPGSTIIIAERGPLPKGASTRNAGFACFGSVSEILDDLQSLTENEVIDLIKMRWNGLQLLRNRVPDHKMDYNHCGGVEVFRTQQDFDEHAEAASKLNALLEQSLGLKHVYTPISDKDDAGMRGFSGKIINKYEGLLHPGKMIQHLIKQCAENNIHILNGLEIVSISESNGKIECNLASGQIHTEKLLIATNGFARQFLPMADVSPARNLVLLTNPLNQNPVHAGYHLDRGYVYFRPVGDRLLIGGARNLDPKTEESAAFQENPLIRSHLEHLLKEQILPNQPFSIDYSWTGIMGVGKIKKPIIEMVSDRIGVAVRMGGMGVAIGSLVGKHAAEMIRFGELTR